MTIKYICFIISFPKYTFIFITNCGNKPLMSSHFLTDGQWKSSTELRNKTIFRLIGIVTCSLIWNDLKVVFLRLNCSTWVERYTWPWLVKDRYLSLVIQKVSITRNYIKRVNRCLRVIYSLMFFFLSLLIHFNIRE